jgi:hypothetical protein
MNKQDKTIKDCFKNNTWYDACLLAASLLDLSVHAVDQRAQALGFELPEEKPKDKKPKEKKKKQHKYRAEKMVIDGHTFDSKKEGRRYQQLRHMEKGGEIRGLELQPRYDLWVPTPKGKKKVGYYRADFRYDEWISGKWYSITEDVKGLKTPVYRLKRKMVEAYYDIVIRET